MEFNVKDMSYGLLQSHTFPGILFEIQILVAFQLFTPIKPIDKLKLLESNALNLIAVLVVVFISSTILGFILDGVHHSIFAKLEDGNYAIYKVIRRADQMQIYRHFVEDDLWYPYEAFANVGISMSPGIFLLPYWLYMMSVHIAFIVIATVVYFLLFCIMIQQARSTLKQCIQVEKALVENFSSDQG